MKPELLNNLKLWKTSAHRKPLIIQDATAEIDFLIQHQNQIIPIEVKAEENLKAKSLKIFFKYCYPRLH